MKRACTEIRILMEENSSKFFTRAASEMHMGIKVSLFKNVGKRSQLTGSTQQNCCLTYLLQKDILLT